MTTLASLICREREDIHATVDDLSDAWLRDVNNDALCLIAQRRPELFAKSEVIKLKAGDEQLIDGCCDTLLAVDMLTDKDGKQLAAVQKTDERMQRVSALFQPKCTPAGTLANNATTPRAVVLDIAILNRFTVTPPVPQGVDVYARVRCSSTPKFFDDYDADASVPCSMYSLIVQYVEAQALIKLEPDSPSAMTRANSLLSRFDKDIAMAQSTILNLRRAAN